MDSTGLKNTVPGISFQFGSYPFSVIENLLSNDTWQLFRNDSFCSRNWNFWLFVQKPSWTLSLKWFVLNVWVLQTFSLFNYYFASHLVNHRIRILINYLPTHPRSPQKYHPTPRVACYPIPTEILYRVFSIVHHKQGKTGSLSTTTWSSVLPWVYSEQVEETYNPELIYILKIVL